MGETPGEGEATPFRLEVDADRDGVVGTDEAGRWDWTWSADGRGAVVLADLDKDPPGALDSEFAELRVAVDEGRELPEGWELALSLDPAAVARVTIHRRSEDGTLTPVVGATAGRDGAPLTVSGPLAPTGETLWVQALGYPGRGFDGLVELFLVAARRPTSEARVLDRALFRVAPWIITPTTCEPQLVYAVDLGADELGNSKFLEELTAATAEAGVPLQVVAGSDVGFDRWIQDEIEFGYSQAPQHTLAVVCDGPRNRELDWLAEGALLGPDVGVVEVRSHLGDADSLDSFGNLDVSPPVDAAGVSYPLGRIVLGTKRPAPSQTGDRKAALALRQFLYAQAVQAPFEIHTDWLAVGHVDEIVSFVPGPGSQGFAVLLASPRRAREFFEQVAQHGGGPLVLWEGQKRIEETGGLVPADESVDDLLGRGELWAFNAWCDEQLGEVADDLRENLGLLADDIVEIPVLFKPVEPGQRALAYFPDMVNHLVLGRYSIVPRPYGPKRDGVDLLEEAFRAAVPGREVRFIDDWLSYHEMAGEVHCGTNVRRRPDESVKWWEHRLPGMWDALVPPRV